MADLRSLNVEDLTCERGGAVILDGLSFSLASGQALFLRGPNGSGKTTLIRALAGLLPLKRGRAFALGDAGRPISDLQSQLHYIGHANGVKDRLSAVENVRFWQRYYDGEDAGLEAAEDALEHFNLLDLADYRAAHLSAGQKRRLGLSRLLVAKRPIWLLDEPSVSLDKDSVSFLETAIARHLADGGVAVVSTHINLRLPSFRTLNFAARGSAVEEFSC